MNKVVVDKFTILLFAALVFGFGLRLAPALVMNNKITWEDESDYLGLAQKISNGEGYVRADGSPTAFRAPGYPMFLALLRFAGIQSPFGIRIVQALLGSIIIWLVYRLGLVVFDRKVGLLSAALIAVYPYYIVMPGTILAETLFTALLLTACLLLFLAFRDSRGKLYFFSAIAMGAAILTRPTAWALVMGIIIWLVVVIRIPFKHRIGLAALFLITVMLAVTPWMTRNYLQLGSFSLATNSGRNFWLGNNPQADMNSGSSVPMDAEMEQRIAAAGSETAAEKIYYAKAYKFISANPRQFILLTIQKGLAFWRWTPSPMSQPGSQDSLLKGLSILSFGPVFILAVTGFVMAPVDLRNKILLWLIFALFYTAAHALFISKVRFRLPLDGFFILTAAFAVMQLIGKFRPPGVKGTVQ